MTDEMLTRIIREACELEFEEIEKRIESECPHTFSETFNKKMDQIMEKEGRQWDTKNQRHFMCGFRIRYILIAVLLLVFGTSMVMGHSFFSERVKNFIYTVFPRYVQIESQQLAEDGTVSISNWKKPEYVPRGYHVIEEEKSKEMGNYIISWSNEENHVISYMQTGSDTTVAVTSDGKEPKEVKIENTIGKLSIDREGRRSLFFEKEKNLFTIVGPISEKEIIRMAESIQ